MASNRAQILISAVDQTKTAFDSIKRGLGGLTDTARPYAAQHGIKLWQAAEITQALRPGRKGLPQ